MNLGIWDLIGNIVKIYIKTTPPNKQRDKNNVIVFSVIFNTRRYMTTKTERGPGKKTLAKFTHLAKEVKIFPLIILYKVKYT